MSRDEILAKNPSWMVWDLWINHEGPFEAVGSDTRSLLLSIGQDPMCFKETGNLITNAVCKKNKDGWIVRQSEAPKPRGLSSKSEEALAKKWDKWAG